MGDSLEVHWYKCKGDIWCEFEKLDTEHKNIKGLHGIYILWCGDSDRKVVKIGSGLISEAIRALRLDLSILAFVSKGLYVTWCDLPSNLCKSIESYLDEKLHPSIQSVNLTMDKIDVNLPW